MIREVHVRDALTDYLFSLNENKMLVEEVGIIRGGFSRADLIDFTEEIHGYEIKTAADSLSRLSKQIEDYNNVCDKITLVVATKYLEKAKSMIPEYWGLIEIQYLDDNIFALIPLREATENTKQNKLYLASLLWADELKKVLQNKNLYRTLASKAHWNMVRRLVDFTDISELRKIVLSTLRSRQSKLSRDNTWKILKQKAVITYE